MCLQMTKNGFLRLFKQALWGRGKEDVYSGQAGGQNRVVILPRNKRSIPAGTLSSIWRQAGITSKIADEIWNRHNTKQSGGSVKMRSVG